MNRKKDYKDLEKYKKTKRKQQKKYYEKTKNSKNSRKRWTCEEEKLVLEHSILDRELSEKIGRSMKAIIMKRVKLKKELEYGRINKITRT